MIYNYSNAPQAKVYDIATKTEITSVLEVCTDTNTIKVHTGGSTNGYVNEATIRFNKIHVINVTPHLVFDCYGRLE